MKLKAENMDPYDDIWLVEIESDNKKIKFICHTKKDAMALIDILDIGIRSIDVTVNHKLHHIKVS